MAADLTTCPVAGCRRAKEGFQVCCKTHWMQLPKAIRDEIWTLYRREQGSDAHRAAVFGAISWLNAKQPAEAKAPRG